MDYRSVLVQVDTSRGAKLRVQAAAAIASRFKARLTGVFLKSEMIPAYLVGEGAVMAAEVVEKFLKERREQVASAGAAARLLFDPIALDAGVPFHWLDINGDNDDELVACARRHDLVVLPRAIRSNFGSDTISAEQVGMASGGPILVLPQAGYPENFGKRILVAWKDSREAARVLRDAWPFLAAAEELHFVTAARGDEPELDELLQRHLASHGCKTPNLIVDNSNDVPAGELIRRHIDQIGADMVVLGLYGHPRFAEFVLGGVSRDMLNHITMPLLVSH